MRTNFLEKQHPLVEFLFIVMIMLTSTIVFTMISMIIGIFAFHIPLNDLDQIMNMLNGNGNIAFLKYMQTTQSIGLFVLPSLLIIYLKGGVFRKEAGFVAPSNSNLYMFGIFIPIAFLPFINFLGELNARIPFPERIVEMEKQAMVLTERLIQADNTAQLLFNLFMIAIIPAVGEELFFRNVIQKYFIKITKNVHVGILIAAVFFSFFHMQFLGFFPRMFLGLIFGYFFVWSGSIYIAIFAHFANNAIALLAMHYVAKGQLSEQIENVGAQPNFLPVAVLSLVLGITLFWYFRKIQRKSAIATREIVSEE